MYCLVHGLASRDQQADEAAVDDEDSSDSEDEEINPLLLDPTQWKVIALAIHLPFFNMTRL